MKREDVKQKHADGVTFYAHVISNPSNVKEWIVLFKKTEGRSFFLVNDAEEIESFHDLDALIRELQLLGIKNAEIHI
ncbi:MAG: hypothetical protein ACI9EB_000501 [Pseudomonas sp.]|jgi:hypothetical protein